MKFINAILMAEAVSGAALTQYRRDNHEKRALERRSNYMQKAHTFTNQTESSFSTNWAGAVINDKGISSVSAVLTAPKISDPHKDGTKSCASAWVGIDGDSCATAILQTGIDFCIHGGSTTFNAWYEWYPEYAYDFDLAVSEGDSIKMTVSATSKTSGTAIVENQTTGKIATKTFNGDVKGPLCQTNAEWIVEDFMSGGSLVPFVDFGTVTFTDASVLAGHNKSLDMSSASIVNIQQSGKTLTSCKSTYDGVGCEYI